MHSFLAEDHNFPIYYKILNIYFQVSAEHHEKNGLGESRNKFVRHFQLPPGVSIHDITPNLTPDGCLIVAAPKLANQPGAQNKCQHQWGRRKDRLKNEDNNITLKDYGWRGVMSMIVYLHSLDTLRDHKSRHTLMIGSL